MSVRMYDYQCEHCTMYFHALREMDDCRKDIDCPHCSKLCDGNKCKRVTVPPEVRFMGGRQKGKYNSHGW